MTTTTYAELMRFSISNVVASSSVVSANIASVGPCSLFFCRRYVDIRIVAMFEESVISVWSRSADSNASA